MMSIVCGTDFSDAAAEAARAAGALARRLGTTLYLVHAQDALAAAPPDSASRMSDAAAALRADGVAVTSLIETGAPETVMADVAAQTTSTLIFIGAPRRHPATPALLGCTAEQTSRCSAVPVVTVRDARPFEQWLDRERPLRIIVATDLSTASQAAVEWVASLRDLARIDVVLAHVFWPPEVHERLQLSGPIFRRRVHPVVREVLERELALQAERLGDAGEVRTFLQPNLGRTADPLVYFATQEHADLLVVGTHQRNALDRLWRGSVSKTIVRLAPMSVACVPTRHESEQLKRPPLRSIVAATDFSETGNLAVAQAYAIAPPGSRVILVHAVESAPRGEVPESAGAAGRLNALIAPAARARGIGTEIHVLEGRSTAATICAAAERFGADLVVVGTEGRAGFARPLFGSVAQEVMLRSRTPVLIVPPAHVLRTRVTPDASEPAVHGAASCATPAG